LETGEKTNESWGRNATKVENLAMQAWKNEDTLVGRVWTNRKGWTVTQKDWGGMKGGRCQTGKSFLTNAPQRGLERLSERKL